MTWNFTANDALTIKLWSTQDMRDAEKRMFFAPMIYSADPTGKGRLKYIQDASKFRGIIRMVSEFEGKNGDRVTIPNVPLVTGRGGRGDEMLRGSGQVVKTSSQDVFFDYFFTQVISGGPLSERRVGLDFIKTNRPSLGNWYMRTLEEGFVLSLFGLTAPNNGSILKNWNATETAVFNNPIVAFDSTQIMYPGAHTSDGTLDSSDVLTAQVLSRLRTFATEDQDIPVEPMTVNGQDCWLFLTSGRGIEQLKAASDFNNVFTKVIPTSDNPLTQRASWQYENIYIAEYPKTLKPAANVGRSLLLGADALLAAKVEDMGYYMNDADDAELRKALSVRGAFGVKVNEIAGIRRNAVALDHYVRT
jgi:hypothetical protein